MLALAESEDHVEVSAVLRVAGVTMEGMATTDTVFTARTRFRICPSSSAPLYDVMRSLDGIIGSWTTSLSEDPCACCLGYARGVCARGGRWIVRGIVADCGGRGVDGESGCYVEARIHIKV